MDALTGLSQVVQEQFEKADETVHEQNPWLLIGLTASLTALTTISLMRFSSEFDWKSFKKRCLRMLPGVEDQLQKKLREFEKDAEREHLLSFPQSEVVITIPEKGTPDEKILARFDGVKTNALNGKNTGAYYIDEEKLDKLHEKVYAIFLRTNGLHVDLFKIVPRLEAEVVRMTLNMFEGGINACGSMTSGGTDSILHAVLVARNHAIANGIRSGWEMIVPTTRHPAFLKGAQYFGLKMVEVPVYPEGHERAFQVDLDQLKSKINSKTVLVVGSAPAFPHGILDPIEEISDILTQHDTRGVIGLHVDACLGGYLVPWMKHTEYGKDLNTKFGFDVPRVTSISADTHKYGYTEKGGSVVMFRNQDWGKHKVTVDNNWSGGIYATPTMAGSRPGHVVANTWATLMSLGQEGYIDWTDKIVRGTREITQVIRDNPSLEVLGNPVAMVIAFRAKNGEDFNIYDLKSELGKKGWYFSALQSPPAIHFCTTAANVKDPEFAQVFKNDIEECLRIVKAYPEDKKGKSGTAQMYKSNTAIGESEFIDEFAMKFWEVIGRAQPHLQHD